MGLKTISRVIALTLVTALMVGMAGSGAGAATYPGGNGYVAYTYYDRFGGNDVVRQAADGSGDEQLTFDGTSSQPTWSPDGTRIAYVTDGHIAVMNADGSDQHLLGPSGSSPTWAPDGSFLAFLNGQTVQRVDAAGSVATTITTTKARRISFHPLSADKLLMGKVVYTISTGQRALVRIRSVSPMDRISSVGFTPNGRSYVFLARCDVSGRCTDALNVYTAPVVGGKRVAVTRRTTSAQCSPFAGCNVLTSVSASPDGQDFLLGEAFNNGGASTCAYALVSAARACDGAGAEVVPGDWQPVFAG